MVLTLFPPMIKILVIINILVLRFYRYIGNILTNYENIKKNSKKVYIYIYIYNNNNNIFYINKKI